MTAASPIAPKGAASSKAPDAPTAPRAALRRTRRRLLAIALLAAGLPLLIGALFIGYEASNRLRAEAEHRSTIMLDLMSEQAAAAVAARDATIANAVVAALIRAPGVLSARVVDCL